MRVRNLHRVFVLSGWLTLLAVSPVKAQVPGLPFRVKPDGTVDQKELLELTKRPTASDRITDAELAVIKKKHEIDYGPGFRPTEKPEMPPRADLYANSVLLSDGVNHTLLPQKALIWVPESLKGRVVERPVGKLILWPDFLKQHRDWLRAYEIPFETAKGEVPLTEEQVDAVRKSPSIVVSVMEGHPISLLAPSAASAASLAATAGEPGPPAPGEGIAATAEAGSSAPGARADTGAGTVGTPAPGKAPAPAAATPKPTRASRFDTSNRFKPRQSK